MSEEGAKYHRARRVPMCSQLKETLFLWVERNKDKFREGYIFYPSHGNQYAKGKHLATITVMARFGEYYKRSKFYSCNKVMKDGKKMGNWSMHKLRHFFASYLNEKNEEVQQFFKKYDIKRKDKGLIIKGLAPKELKLLFIDRKSLKMKYTEFPIPHGISICKNKIAFISWGEKPIGYLIESEQISQMFKEFFNNLWNKY